MDYKNKFSKNIFTEVIPEDPKQQLQIEEKKVEQNEKKSITPIEKKLEEEEKKEIPKKNDDPPIKKEENISSKDIRKNIKIEKIINQQFINITELKNLCWQGIPFNNNHLRGECWKFLLGFYPLNSELKKSAVQRKKDEYSDMCRIYSNALSNPDSVMNDQELKTYKQIQKDVPRTMPEYPMFQNEKIKFMLTRILYIWSMRHPASGYVQGFNDLCVPFFIVFFLDFFNHITINELLNKGNDDLNNIKEDNYFELETDIYYSLTKLLDRIQTNYTHNQPGIVKMIKRMELIIETVDKELYDYLKEKEIDYVQFCFRWMNCFLIREFPINLMIRLWDTYFSEENGFSDFHLYVCACLLLGFSEKLKQMTEFQDLIVFLQNLPTSQWTLEDIDILLAKAYSIRELYSSIFKDKE